MNCPSIPVKSVFKPNAFLFPLSLSSKREKEISTHWYLFQSFFEFVLFSQSKMWFHCSENLLLLDSKTVRIKLTQLWATLIVNEEFCCQEHQYKMICWNISAWSILSTQECLVLPMTLKRSKIVVVKVFFQFNLQF